MKLILSIAGAGLIIIGGGVNITDHNWLWVLYDFVAGGAALYYAYAVLE